MQAETIDDPFFFGECFSTRARVVGGPEIGGLEIVLLQLREMLRIEQCGLEGVVQDFHHVGRYSAWSADAVWRLGHDRKAEFAQRWHLRPLARALFSECHQQAQFARVDVWPETG